MPDTEDIRLRLEALIASVDQTARDVRQAYCTCVELQHDAAKLKAAVEKYSDVQS